MCSFTVLSSITGLNGHSTGQSSGNSTHGHLAGGDEVCGSVKRAVFDAASQSRSAVVIIRRGRAHM